MAGLNWKPPHQTARQKAKRRSKLDAAILAPLAAVAVRCGNCGHQPGMHGVDDFLGAILCFATNCTCTDYREEAK